VKVDHGAPSLVAVCGSADGCLATPAEPDQLPAAILGNCGELDPLAGVRG
jgi:hypothetical protein